MQCPIDQAELQMMDRQGIEIDYCPRCRGVWLDRGELDKLIERSTSVQTATDPRGARPAVPYTEQQRPPYRDDRYRNDQYRYRDDDDDDDDRYGHRGRKRRGWLGDIFDFD
jgi:Zn-finger nucleic acid-binding protein